MTPARTRVRLKGVKTTLSRQSEAIPDGMHRLTYFMPGEVATMSVDVPARLMRSGRSRQARNAAVHAHVNAILATERPYID